MTDGEDSPYCSDDITAWLRGQDEAGCHDAAALINRLRGAPGTVPVRLLTATTPEAVAILRQEADARWGEMGIGEVSFLCRLLGVTGIHASLDDSGWTVVATDCRGWRHHESTRPTLRQALACALVQHVREEEPND